MTHKKTTRKPSAGQMHHPGYPDIGSLAVIGDGHSLALVSGDGAIEWFCPNRFDAPPLFWQLLDRRRGGCLRVGLAGKPRVRTAYHGDTAVLEQRWHGAKGSCRITLCMEWPADAGRQSLLWVVDDIAGEVSLQVDFVPRADFGQAPCRAGMLERAIELRCGDQRLVFQSGCPLRAQGDGWQGQVSLHTGERLALRLDLGLPTKGAPPSSTVESVAAAIDATARAWQAWSDKLAWQDRYREAVVRSAITLKLLIYQPSGAVVAAGTTSLPEEIGGERNWDYRYTWFRDAGLTLAALLALGCRDEANNWARWIASTIERNGLPLRILYTVDGKKPPRETRVAGVDGYRGSRPVRLGNAAERQHQLDIYGELLQCVYICDTMGDKGLHAHWPYMRATADYIAAHWREPDSGIWEVRSEPRQFVHSKIMAWAGLQRALWLQRRHGLEANVDAWRRERDALRADVLYHGLSRDGRHFVRAYGDQEVDASLLLLPRSGFIRGNDPLFRNTVRAIRQRLAIEGQPWLLRRYHADMPDGLTGTEGAFVICSFWLVDALVAMGEHSEAEALFARMLATQGRHGLYAEEIDPCTGVQLGNLPQAYSHVGLINAALRLCRGLHIPGETAPLAPVPD